MNDKQEASYKLLVYLMQQSILTSRGEKLVYAYTVFMEGMVLLLLLLLLAETRWSRACCAVAMYRGHQCEGWRSSRDLTAAADCCVHHQLAEQDMACQPR